MRMKRSMGDKPSATWPLLQQAGREMGTQVESSLPHTVQYFEGKTAEQHKW